MKNLSKTTDRLVGQPMFGLLIRVKEVERVGKEIIHFEIEYSNFNTPNLVV